jgi:hypothetical protein
MEKRRRNMLNAFKTYRAPLRFLWGWVLVAVLLVVLLSVAFYRLETQSARIMLPDTPDSVMRMLVVENQIAARLLAACIAMSTGVLVLALITAHRMAGPYVALKRTFDLILEGDKEQRLHFRDYDKLDDVEASFNRLMDKLTASEAGELKVVEEPEGHSKAS